MSRPIRFRSRSAHPADAVYAATVDHDQLIARLAELGGHGAELLDHSANADGAQYRLRHGLAADELPAMARTFLPSDLVIERTETWQREGAGRYRGDVEVSIPGTPGKVGGRQTLADADGGSELVMNGHVEVPVPFIGGKIEDIIVEQVERLVAAETNFTQQWLAANTAS